MRQKLYALVQIAGLGIGLACSMLIGIHVRYELGYDRQFRHAERIFRLVWPDNACMPNPLAAVLERELPEVERAVRVQQRYRPLISHDEKRHFYRVHFADEGFQRSRKSCSPYEIYRDPPPLRSQNSLRARICPP